MPDLVLGQSFLEILQDVLGVVEAAALIDGDIDVVCAESLDEFE